MESSAESDARVMADRAIGAALFAAGFSLRLALILLLPAVYGGDAAARLARSDELQLAYQLPLPQLVVFVVRGIQPDPLWTRLAFSAIGALVPVALWRALVPSAGRAAALAAAALATLHPMLVYYSMVPYQEPLLLLLLLAAAVALQRGRDAWAGLWIGLACLCRFEAWIAAALAVLGRRRKLGWARSVGVFGWAAIGWVLLWRGLSPAGTYVLDLDPDAARALRLSFLAGKLHEYSGTATIALAAAGVVAVPRATRARPLAWGAGFVAAVLLAVVAAGHEFPPGSGRVSERLAQLPAVALCALAGIAFGAAFSAAPARFRTGVVALGAVAFLAQAVVWLRFTRDLVRQATREPGIELAYEVARAADALLGPGERLAVVAPPVEPAMLEDYVRKVERAHGDVDAARAVARSLARHSPDTDRIAANLARPPHTVVEDAGDAALLAVFDDAPARPDLGAPLARFVAGPRGVSLYRTRTR